MAFHVTLEKYLTNTTQLLLFKYWLTFVAQCYFNLSAGCFLWLRFQATRKTICILHSYPNAVKATTNKMASFLEPLTSNG